MADSAAESRATADPKVARVVERVRAGAKYRQIVTAAVERLAAEELSHGRGVRDAAKAVRRRLHQVAGAYVSGRIRYDAWYERLQSARTQGEPAFRQACLDMMRLHASTRERQPILDRFYDEMLRDIGPIHSVIDVGCGLGPLAVPWMPLSEGGTYWAYDLYHDLAEFLDAFWSLTAVDGHAEARDAIVDVPRERADLAMVLKLLPCAEQMGRGLGLALLDSLQAPRILVTFPVASLGGRGKGMERHYQEEFLDMVSARHWAIERQVFATELAFLIQK